MHKGFKKSFLFKLNLILIVCHIFMYANIGHIGSTAALEFKPAPYQDTEKGRNTNVYSPAINGPSSSQQHAFVEEITKYALHANEQWEIPTSVIIAMSIIESGYGTTHTAYNANNLFGIKVWKGNDSNAWQLKGQPNEDYEDIPIIDDYGEDRLIFDESVRRDNWYRTFHSYNEAVNYLAGTLLLNDRYHFALLSYKKRVENGWSQAEASQKYAYDIAEAGYNHRGGNYYRKVIGDLMDQWDLYKYDQKHEKVESRKEKKTEAEKVQSIETNETKSEEVKSREAHETEVVESIESNESKAKEVELEGLELEGYDELNEIEWKVIAFIRIFFQILLRFI